MSSVLDYVALAVFFIVYRYRNLYYATGVLMTLSALQLVVHLLKKQAITRERWFNTGMVLVLGGASLLLKDERFIKLKPTLYYLAVAVALKITAKQGQTLLEDMLGQTVKLPAHVWLRLNTAWIVFMSCMAILNTVIAYTATTRTWVYFKLFGSLGLMCLFIFSQSIYLSLTNNRHE